jgi:hypothetical protein
MVKTNSAQFWAFGSWLPLSFIVLFATCTVIGPPIKIHMTFHMISQSKHGNKWKEIFEYLRKGESSFKQVDMEYLK